MTKRFWGVLLASSILMSAKAADWGSINPAFNAHLPRRSGDVGPMLGLKDGRLLVTGWFDAANNQAATNGVIVMPDGSIGPFPAASSVADWFTLAETANGQSLAWAALHREGGEGYSVGFHAIDANGALATPNPFAATVSSSMRSSSPVRHPDGLLTFIQGSRWLQFLPDGTLHRDFEPVNSSPLFWGYPMAGLAGGKLLITVYNFLTGESFLAVANNQGLLESEPHIRGFSVFPHPVQAENGSFFVVIRNGPLSLLKFDATGALVPDFQSALGTNTSFESVFPTSDGGALVAGSIQLTNHTPYRTLVKLSSSGAVDPDFDVATRDLGYVSKIAQGPSNTWYINATEGTDSVIRKIAENGTIDSSFRVSIYRRPTVQSIAVLPGGQVAFGGPSATDVGETNGPVSVRDPDGSHPTAPSHHTTREVWDLAALPDGSLLVLGFAPDFGLFTRIYPDGSALPGFHANLSSVGSGEALRPLIHPLADGKILIGGGQVEGFDTNYAGTGGGPLTLLLSNGQPDFEFKSARVFSSSSSSLSLFVAADGKILLSGNFSATNGSPLPAVVRLRPNGTLDETFQYGPGSPPHRPVLGQFSNGRILLGDAGTTNASERAQALIRLKNDGSIDSGFRSVLGAGSRITAAAIQQDDRILVGGQLWHTHGSRLSTLVRFEPDGTLDESFAANFTATRSPPEIYRILVLPDGDVLVAGMFEMDGQLSLVKLRSAEKPRLRPVSISGSSLLLELSGNTGKTYVVQSSSNLVDWLPAGTVTLDSATRTTPVPLSGDGGGRFHRAVLVTEP